jgi:hypothetical protein
MAGSTTSVDSNDAWLLVPAFERCPWALDAASDDEAPRLVGRAAAHSMLQPTGAPAAPADASSAAGARTPGVEGSTLQPAGRPGAQRGLGRGDFLRQSVHRNWRQLATWLLLRRRRPSWRLGRYGRDPTIMDDWQHMCKRSALEDIESQLQDFTVS